MRCKENSKIVDACYENRCRISLFNGNPTMRVWKVWQWKRPKITLGNTGIRSRSRKLERKASETRAVFSSNLLCSSSHFLLVFRKPSYKCVRTYAVFCTKDYTYIALSWLGFEHALENVLSSLSLETCYINCGKPVSYSRKLPMKKKIIHQRCRLFAHPRSSPTTRMLGLSEGTNQTTVTVLDLLVSCSFV